jgi:hypothetical protein
VFASEERRVLELARFILTNSFRRLETCEFIGLLLTPTVFFSGGISKRGGVGIVKHLLGESRRAARKKRD